MQEILIKDKKYPEQLLQINDAPKSIYANGNVELLTKNSIAIVGTRECSEYGWRQAGKFAKELAKRDICVVSGMAVGIDTSAHQGAIKERGKTIAVLGSGFEHIYPEQNKQLYHEIIDNGGCVLTEYPPEVKEHSSHFPRRNRIISGLAMGVLVVEAKHRSGSTITAHLAMQQKKEVFCVPSNLEEKTGRGTNLLIKNGAHLVTCVEDILQYYDIEENNEIDEKYEDIFSLLSKEPISVNEICKISQKKVSEVNEILFMLEIEGKVKNLPGGFYVKTN